MARIPEDEQRTPTFHVIARAVAAWPDTQCVQVTSGWRGSEPTREELDKYKKMVHRTYVMQYAEQPERVAAVVLPYCAEDEDED